MDDHRVTAVPGGVKLGFQCDSCGAETTILKPYRPDADATESVATPNGANGNGRPAGANGARQNGRESGNRRGGWTDGIKYGRGTTARRKVVAGMTGKRGDEG